MPHSQRTHQLLTCTCRIGPGEMLRLGQSQTWDSFLFLMGLPPSYSCFLEPFLTQGN